jgi:hypothetical protein
MKKETYVCDVCGDCKAPAELIGFEFSDSPQYEHRFREAPPTFCNRHLCWPCATGLYRLLGPLIDRQAKP